MLPPQPAHGNSAPRPDSRVLRILDIVNIRGLWVGTLALGAWGIIDGLRLGFGSFGSPGPGLWPIILGVPTVFFSIILFLRRMQETGVLSELAGGEESGTTGWAWAVMVVIVLVTAMLPWAGLYLGIGLFCLISARVISRLDWWVTAIVTLTIPLACYLIFEVGLSVRIPRGLLGTLNLF